MEWNKLEGYIDTYYTSKIFNGYTYNVFIYAEKSNKTIKYWVSASSGKKRKEFEIFENKEFKSLGGIKALFWIKEAMYDFPKWYNDLTDRKEYICISWADNRRREIYKRLQKENFIFMTENKKKILIKQL